MMAYFPNGTAGAYLDEQCAECIHEDPEAGCPVALIQDEYNYSQLNKGNGDLKRAMDILISETGDCKMKEVIDKYYKKLPLERVGGRPKYKPSKLWGKS